MPPVRRAQPFLGAIVAVLAVADGLFGALMLLCGIPGIPYVMFHANSADFAGDVFQLTMFLLIGFFCLYIAVRWLREAARLLSGK
jgi:hypothetical protein